MVSQKQTRKVSPSGVAMGWAGWAKTAAMGWAGWAKTMDPECRVPEFQARKKFKKLILPLQSVKLLTN